MKMRTKRWKCACGTASSTTMCTSQCNIRRRQAARLKRWQKRRHERRAIQDCDGIRHDQSPVSVPHLGCRSRFQYGRLRGTPGAVLCPHPRAIPGRDGSLEGLFRKTDGEAVGTAGDRGSQALLFVLSFCGCDSTTVLFQIFRGRHPCSVG